MTPEKPFPFPPFDPSVIMPYSEVVDLTKVAVYAIVDPGKLFSRRGLNIGPTLEVKDWNAVTVAPMLSIGTNAPNYDNICEPQVLASMLTSGPERIHGVGLTPAPMTALDLSVGVFVNVTVPATAAALTARFGLPVFQFPITAP